MTRMATWTSRSLALAMTAALTASCVDTNAPAESNVEESGAQAAEADAGAVCKEGEVGNTFAVERLVSDDPALVPADFTDPLLKNPWGLASGPNTVWWVANNGTDTATLYDGQGEKQALEVSVPGAPTGEVFNDGDDFVVTSGSASGAARFLWATESGTLLAWSPAVPPPAPSTQAFVVVDNSAKEAIYKGLAIATTPHGDRLYATDFHNAKVDVFDDRFRPVSLPVGAFVDEGVPTGYGPFGIREINGRIFVTYARQDAEAEDDVAGLGLGFVDAYDTDGALLFRVATRGHLDAPWGLALAPQGFGRFGDALLVGNFGDGKIHAFDLTRCVSFGCKELGVLRDEAGEPIAIDGLWALDFGKGNNLTGDKLSLYFTAGPNDEKNGLFGFIVSVDDP